MVKYHCDYCSKDISYDLRIKCAVCTDFDLCIECFSVGVEIQLHRNDHAYQVMVTSKLFSPLLQKITPTTQDQLNFPVFKSDWAASEELLLLEGIGNSLSSLLHYPSLFPLLSPTPLIYPPKHLKLIQTPKRYTEWVI